MYKVNGGMYIGYFKDGKAQGRGAMIFPDGSFYFGDFFRDKADSFQATYKSDTLTYKGSFKDNAFEGQGEE